MQWRQRLFDNVPVYNIKNKPVLRYKFGSVYMHMKSVCSQFYVQGNTDNVVRKFISLCFPTAFTAIIFYPVTPVLKTGFNGTS